MDEIFSPRTFRLVEKSEKVVDGRYTRNAYNPTSEPTKHSFTFPISLSLSTCLYVSMCTIWIQTLSTYTYATTCSPFHSLRTYVLLTNIHIGRERKCERKPSCRLDNEKANRFFSPSLSSSTEQFLSFETRPRRLLSSYLSLPLQDIHLSDTVRECKWSQEGDLNPGCQNHIHIRFLWRNYVPNGDRDTWVYVEM